MKILLSLPRAIWRLLRNHNEELTLVIAVALFFLSPRVLHWVDPTAGVYDAGILQLLIVSIIAFCVFNSFNWLIMRIVWPSIRSYFENHFAFDFNELTPWQKIKTSLFIYFSLFLALVALFVKVA
jgi:hypothetical protein